MLTLSLIMIGCEEPQSDPGNKLAKLGEQPKRRRNTAWLAVGQPIVQTAILRTKSSFPITKCSQGIKLVCLLSNNMGNYPG